MTSFLLNDTTALDAGSLTTSLSLRRQEKVRRIVVTHAHFDHVASLPFFFENVFGRTAPVEIIAPAAVLSPLMKHLFNDALWPDFSQLPSRRQPSLKFRRLEEGTTYSADGLSISPVAVTHVVPTYGYLVSRPGAAILFSGDTAPTRNLWRLADRTEDLKAVFLEVSFRNGLADVARASKHLIPKLLESEIAKTKRNVPIYLYHMKPPSLPAIRREVASLRNPRFHLLREGEVLVF